MRRPGLRVRARGGYFAPKGNATPAAKPTPVQRALRDVFDADGIPLRLAAYVMGPAPVSLPTSEEGGLEVLFAGEVRLDALQVELKDGRRVAQPRFELLTSSLAGESHDSDWSLEVTLGPSLPEHGEALWHPFVTRIAMSPGSHRARLVVQDGERLGSVTVDFIVPRPGEERLSTPVLSDRLLANASERRVLPLARRVFETDSTLHCWLELVGAGVDPATGQSRAQAEFVVRTREGREWASGPATAMNLERGRPTRLVSVPLAGAAVGEHELVVRVKDEITGGSFEVREPFRIDGVGGGAGHVLSTAGGAGGLDGASVSTTAPEPPNAPVASPGAGLQDTAAAVQPGAVERPPSTSASQPSGVLLADGAALASQADVALRPTVGTIPSAASSGAPVHPSPPPSAGTPTFKAGTEVVVLDVIVRDGKNQPVADLRSTEIQVFEDGRRCEVQSFRHVHAAAGRARIDVPPATPAASGTAAAIAAADTESPSRPNLVVLLFQAMFGRPANDVREAALDLLGRRFPPNTWIAVYSADSSSTRLLQPFTNSGERLRRAVLDATESGVANRSTGSKASSSPGARSNARGAETPTDDPAAAALQKLDRAAGEIAAGTAGAEGAHFASRNELATFSGIRAIVQKLAELRGRKAIVYFAPDWQLGGGEVSGGRASLVYEKAMSDANRSNVTVHTVDATGLTCSRVGDRSAFEAVCGGAFPTSSVSLTAATESVTASQGILLGDPERWSAMGRPTLDNFIPIRSGSLLEHVAEETGGLAIRNTNDLSTGLERVIEELSDYYEVVYTPPIPVPDGRYRRIQAKTTRPGVHVRTRAGYFATPRSTPTPVEVPASAREP